MKQVIFCIIADQLHPVTCFTTYTSQIEQNKSIIIPKTVLFFNNKIVYKIIYN